MVPLDTFLRSHEHRGRMLVAVVEIDGAARTRTHGAVAFGPPRDADAAVRWRSTAVSVSAARELANARLDRSAVQVLVVRTATVCARARIAVAVAGSITRHGDHEARALPCHWRTKCHANWQHGQHCSEQHVLSSQCPRLLQTSDSFVPITDVLPASTAPPAATLTAPPVNVTVPFRLLNTLIAECLQQVRDTFVSGSCRGWTWTECLRPECLDELDGDDVC